MAELVSDDVDGPSILVVERDELLPADEGAAERVVGLGQGGIASGWEQPRRSVRMVLLDEEIGRAHV